MFFLICVSVKKYMCWHQPLHWCNTTFPEMDEVIWVGAVPVFIHHDCVKLIGNGGAYKLSCALKPLSILNMGSITSFLPTSLSTCLKWKIKKKRWEKWMKKYGNFFPTIVSFLMWSMKWRCKEINKKKTFFVKKFPFCKCLCLPQESFILLSFYESLLVISWF